MIPADSFDAETDTGGRAGECPTGFAARLAAVNERFGGRALPKWMRLPPGGPQIKGFGYWEEHRSLSRVFFPVQERTAAHAWTGWLIERLGLGVVPPRNYITLVHGRCWCVRWRDERAGLGPALAEACLNLLEQWRGGNPFEEPQP